MTEEQLNAMLSAISEGVKDMQKVTTAHVHQAVTTILKAKRCCGTVSSRAQDGLKKRAGKGCGCATAHLLYAAVIRERVKTDWGTSALDGKGQQVWIGSTMKALARLAQHVLGVEVNDALINETKIRPSGHGDWKPANVAVYGWHFPELPVVSAPAAVAPVVPVRPLVQAVVVPQMPPVGPEQSHSSDDVPKGTQARDEDTAPNVAKKQKVEGVPEDALATIYKLVYVPENRAVYTGRTKDPERCATQHHLVRNAMRRYGRSKFKIEPIMRCSADDADANESCCIMANNTMYPEGYNLRHGAMAGAESQGDARNAERACVTIPFEDMSDELYAEGEAYADLAEICEGLEARSATEELCEHLLWEVHSPDKAGDTRYSATEVAAMLHQVMESVVREGESGRV